MCDAAELLDGVVAILLVRLKDTHGQLCVPLHLILQCPQVSLGTVVWQLTPVDSINHSMHSSTVKYVFYIRPRTLFFSEFELKKATADCVLPCVYCPLP